MARLILASLLAAGAAVPVKPPRPAPALQELSPLLGTWQCSGTQRLSPSEKPSPVAGLWAFARDLDGFWIAVQQDQERSDTNPHPARAKGTVGYSAAQQRFVLLLATNDGLSEQDSSAGWDGPKLVFYGQLRDGDDTVNFRRTFEARGGALKVKLELELTDKEWTQVSEERCSAVGH